jgi:PAS domain-containing protein
MRFSSRAGIGLILLAIVAAGGTFITLSSANERDREARMWEERLSAMSNERAREVQGWVDQQFREIESLSNNAALQIYASALLKADATEAESNAAQAQYLRSLLLMSSQRLSPRGSANANTKDAAPKGLALLDAQGKPHMSTPGLALASPLALTQQATPQTSPQLSISRDAASHAQLRLVQPVYGVQADRAAQAPLAYLLAVQPLNPLLAQWNAVAADAPADLQLALVTRDGASLAPIDAAATGARALPADALLKQPARTMAVQTQASQPLGVLASASPIRGTPWVVVASISEHAAFAGSRARSRMLLIGGGLATVALAALVLGLWRHASARASAALADRLGARAALLQAVTQHQPEALYMLDGEGHIWFANQAACSQFESDSDALRGKALANVAGQGFTSALWPSLQEALRTSNPLSAELQRPARDGGARTIEARFIPMRELPIANLPAATPGVLVVERDVTDMLAVREQRNRTLQQLVSLTVSLIDRRDPHAAAHSSNVAELTGRIAQQLGLDAVQRDTARTAARLMNLGKADIPAEWLTRRGTLQSDEQLSIRNSLATSAALVEDIAFEGPVAQTLREAQETFDGHGPQRLRGDAILLPARIIAVANAMIGMISPRAWRRAMSVDEALATLDGEAGKRFDGRVITALRHDLENHGGRAWLESTLVASDTARKSA